MFKLFVLLSLWAAFAYAAPSLPILTSSSSLHHSYPAVHVVRPIYTSHSIVRPIIHGGLSLGHNGYNGGYGHGHGWL